MDPGLFVAGRWRPDGSYHPDGFTFSCATGAIAKCVRDFGYKPWDRRVSPARQRGTEMIDMRPLHLACVRAVRADYCGDGQSHTRAGTLVAMVDSHDFNPHRPAPGFVLEAEFGADGAVSVSRPRWPLDSPLACAERLPRRAQPASQVGGRVTVYSRVSE